VPRRQRNAAGLCRGASSVLEREGFNVLWSRSNKADSSCRALTGKLYVFTQKTVAGMDCLCTSFFSGIEDSVK